MRTQADRLLGGPRFFRERPTRPYSVSVTF